MCIFYVVTVNLFTLCLQSTNPGQEVITLNFTPFVQTTISKHFFFYYKDHEEWEQSYF